MIEVIVTVTILILALLFLLYSFLTSKKAKDIKKKYNIQKGKITYTDLDKPGKPLFSKKFNLVGKPDYIVKRGDSYIPVEVKNTETDKPYKNHIMQLASYCILLEESGKKVPFGVISYRNKQFKIPFDGNLKYEITELLEKIRDEIKVGKVERNHNNPNKCIYCPFRNVCNFKLG